MEKPLRGPPEELNEKDFIQEEYKKNPFPLWLWLFVSLGVLLFLWSSTQWYQTKMNKIIQANPFLQVTNRQFSLFLWQNPEFMRVNAKEKANYLPGFLYLDQVVAEKSTADEYVVAPPEILFRYHTWDRLIKDDFIPTPIQGKEFFQFLNDDGQWLPIYWPAAPHDYVALVAQLEAKGDEDLSSLPFSVLPKDVRIAFQGWHNYFMDGEALNQIKPTKELLDKFIKSHPHFARNYWRNVVAEHHPNYLISLKTSSANTKTVLSPEELTGFLRVAFFNYEKDQSAFLIK